MQLRNTLLTFISAMVLAIPALVWASTLEVRDAAVSTGVHDRVPTGISATFDSSVGTLYAFTRIVGADADTRIYHKWYHGGELMADIPLSIRSGDWRTWSSKTILPEWTGSWRVVVVSEDGTVLGTVDFSLN